MIKKLEEKNRKEVLDFLKIEPSINLFIIGNLHDFGFENEMQDVYGDYRENKLIGVLLRFGENFIPYYNTLDFDVDGFFNIMKMHKEKKMISGKELVVLQYMNVFDQPVLQPTFFCELKTNEYLRICELDIKIATTHDAQRIYEFMNNIDEFRGPGNKLEKIMKRIEAKLGRIYYVEDEHGEIVTISQTTAVNDQFVMVIGVGTRIESRSQGLMSQCLSQLCSDVLDEGKSLCLFYDNLEAGNVYQRIGFQAIDRWLMITNKIN